MWSFPMDYLYGLLNLSFTGYVIVTLVMVQITIMGVTLYLHRDQAHRSVDLHPVLRHFFRLWVWMTSGMLTKEWVAVHRKHHALCEVEGDPHSPKVFGLPKVLFEGAELYQIEQKKPETLEKYGRGTPDDWLERNVYHRYPSGGIVAMVLIDLLLFGVPGIIIIAVQMVTMPLFAAGVINGLGHHSGYRNFETDDASTNLIPWGVLVGGEELHNNHHAFPSSSKFSIRPWEFDIGWLYLKIFSAFGLAKIRRTAPQPELVETSRSVDLDTVRAVVLNRMHVLREYTKSVSLPVLKNAMREADQEVHKAMRKARGLIKRQSALLDEKSRARIRALVDSDTAMKTVHEYRERLKMLWNGAHDSNERLLQHLREWCAQAEASGIQVLKDFAVSLRGYHLAADPA